MFFPHHNKMIYLIIHFKGQLIFLPSKLKGKLLRMILSNGIKPTATVLFKKKNSRSPWWGYHLHMLICLFLTEIIPVGMLYVVGVKRFIQPPGMILLKAETKIIFPHLFLPWFLLIYCSVIKSIISILQCTILSFCDCFNAILNEIEPITQHFSCVCSGFWFQMEHIE